MTPESSFAPPGQSGALSFPGSITLGNFAKAVLVATAIAGTLDIIAAHLHIWAASGSFPTRVFKGIAGGAVGREHSMQGGAGMVLLGIIFHYFISLSFTLLYFVIHPRLSLLRKNVLVSALLYSLAVWCTMSFVVLPFSALHAPIPNFANKHTYFGMIVLITVFGLPIALSAARFYQRRQT
jgi:hypothetical protein